MKRNAGVRLDRILIAASIACEYGDHAPVWVDLH